MKGINSMFLAIACILCIGLLPPPFAMAGSGNGPIIIGVPTSLGFTSGRECLKSVTLAVEEINAKGGVMVGDTKRKFQVESIDIRDAAPGVPVPEALLGIEKIILDKKVHAILVGPFRSEALLAGMDIVAKHKVPMLGTIAMTPASEAKIKKDPEKYKYIFRVGINVKYFVGYMMGIMKYLNKEFGFNRVFIMHQDVLWARGSAKGFSALLKKGGWSILEVEAYPTGASDFSTGLIKARATGAQVILPIFDMPQAGILVKQWRSMKVPAIMSGIIVPLAGSDAWKAFEGKIAGALNMVFEIGSMPVPKVPESVHYFNAYKKRWGEEVQEQHGPAPAYESVYILAEAIERAGSLDPDALVAALEKTDRMGAIGRIRFDDGHQVIFGNDPSQTALGCMIQWREGAKRVVVYPEVIAEDKILLPTWIKSAK